jgi:hypothetical protein
MARQLENPQQKFKEVIIDEPETNTCYLVCYTVTCARTTRITSVVKCTEDDTGRGLYYHDRILRTDDQKLWADIRSHI